MKKFFSLLILALFALTGCGGGGGGDDSPSLTSISVTPANNKLPTGTNQQYTATGNYSNGTTQNLTSSVAWSSSNNSVATINAAGLVTTVAEGTTTITAATGGISGSTTLTAESLNVNPPVGPDVNVQGTWIGTYTITESIEQPAEVGQTYPYKFELSQTGNSVTGTATLRGGTPNVATSFQFYGTVTGNRLGFTFSYLAPWDANNRVNGDDGAGSVTTTVTPNRMDGVAFENYNGGYSGKYTFTLYKQ